MKTNNEKTRGRLHEEGGVDTGDGWQIRMPDGGLWDEKPSENGNGWWAGDSSDTDNLLYVQIQHID